MLLYLGRSIIVGPNKHRVLVCSRTHTHNKQLINYWFGFFFVFLSIDLSTWMATFILFWWKHSSDYWTFANAINYWTMSSRLSSSFFDENYWLFFLFVVFSIHYGCGVKNIFVVLMQVLETNFDINISFLSCWCRCMRASLYSQFIWLFLLLLLLLPEMNSRTGSTVKVIISRFCFLQGNRWAFFSYSSSFLIFVFLGLFVPDCSIPVRDQIESPSLSLSHAFSSDYSIDEHWNYSFRVC